jgi:hypothetical protein
MAQILTFKSFVMDAAVVNAQNQLEFLNLQFTDYFLRNILGIQSFANLSEMQDLFLDDTEADFEAIKERLVAQSNLRKLHYLTLLRNDGTIFLGANKNRTGELWDPANLITTLKQTGAPYSMTTEVITQVQLNQESPPEYFEGGLSYKAKEHMRRAGTDGLIQFIAAPIVANSTQLGYVVFGHIISGDTILMERSVSLFGTGFGLILFKDTNGNPTEAIEVYINRGLYTFAGTGLSSAEKSDFLNSGLAVDNGAKAATKKITVKGTEYMTAFKSTPSLQVGTKQTDEQALAVVLIGHPLDSVNNVLQEVISTSLGLTALCLIIDTVGMLVSVRLFIDPLDRLQTFIKLKVYKKYDSLLREISLNKRYALRVMLFSFLSIIVLIVMIVLNSSSLQTVFALEGQSSRQLKLMEYAYDLGPSRNVRLLPLSFKANPCDLEPWRIFDCRGCQHQKSP